VTALRQRQFLGRCHMSQKAVALDLFFGTRGAGVRVLLVGVSLTAGTSCACLSAAGYDVQREQAGKAALAALDQAPFDLIIVDWELPDRDGDGLCQTSRVGSVTCP
jgi:PleD family two-component response regulator